MLQHPDIPSPETLQPSFFSDILRSSGYAQAAVASFSAEVIGTGQVAKCIRFKLKLSAGDSSVPQTLIGKFPSDNEKSRLAAATYHSYAREVLFYQTLASKVHITIPDCYFAAISEDASNFALILSDMAPAVQGDQLTGCSEAVLTKAVTELAGLHAPTWNNRALFAGNAYLNVDEASRQQGRLLYKRLLPPFVERFRRCLSSDQIDIFRQLGEASYPVFTTDMPFMSVVHGDYRLDNFLIKAQANKPALTVVDWQTYTSANPLFDVAYAMATSLQVVSRRQHEQAIVQIYHQVLVKAGVPDFSFDDCWLAYRKAAFSGFPITVVASVGVVQTERGDAMFALMADRLSQMALDLQAAELLH